MRLSQVVVYGLVAALGPLTANCQVLTVCEVLRSLDRYKGKIISVRGREGGGEGLYLFATDCEYGLTTKGFRWSNTLYLTYFSDSAGSRTYYPGAVESGKKMRMLLSKLGRKSEDQLIATVTGRLESSEKIDDQVVWRDNHVLAFGFGPDFDSPAQLVIYKESDPELRRYVSIRPGTKTLKRERSLPKRSP